MDMCFFIPGNHDWARGKIGGKKRLKYQSDVLNKKIENESGILNKDEGIFQPLDGLPGPYVYDIGNTRLVIIDTHWFLHGNARGKYEGMNLKDTTKPNSGMTLIISCRIKASMEI